MKKEFIWDSDWELLVLSAFRWELQSKEEHKVSDFIKENTDRFTPKGLHNALQDCIDVVPIDKEWKPNVNKEPMRKYLEKHQKSFSGEWNESEKYPMNDSVEHIVDYATQYSIGRETYMPGVVLDFIHKYKDMFTDSLKKKIVDDIEYAQNLGSFDDPERWNTLKKELLKEVREKGETL